MKIEKLYKLTLNYDYTENDKMVFKYAFDMLFDMGLERNKAETIKFIQTIIDEGYFNRQELYNEALKVPDLYFTRAIKEALYILTGKAICTNNEAKNLFLDYVVKVFPSAVSVLNKIKISDNNKLKLDAQTVKHIMRQSDDRKSIYIIMILLFYDTSLSDQKKGITKAVNNQAEEMNKQLNNRDLDEELSIEFGESFLYSKLYLRFLEKRTGEILDYVSNNKSTDILDSLEYDSRFINKDMLEKFSKKEQEDC